MPHEDEQQEYQKNLKRRVSEALKRAQAEEQQKEMMKQFLEPAAFDRLMNIRAANPELYRQLNELIIQLVQTRRITGKLTEAQLKSILAKMTDRREPTIEFKHK
ncbi:MAG TPA: DNA-binding protein [Candidatus Baltobacteraceae bacterium]|nr:DNA-binding protein [Candidatus Baltobacteraceae bacterium]